MMSKGTLIAAAVAGLFASGGPAMAAAKGTAKAAGEKVRCEGVNSCKGQSACKGADNACKGQNGCKGKGVVEMTAKQCKANGGTVVPPEGK